MFYNYVLKFSTKLKFRFQIKKLKNVKILPHTPGLLTVDCCL